MSVYRGRSVDEVIPQIQRDLGSDAIIVRRREGLTGGILGFFQHPFVEIEALPGAPGIDVYDEPQSVAPVPTPPQVQVQPQAPPPAPAGPGSDGPGGDDTLIAARFPRAVLRARAAGCAGGDGQRICDRSSGGARTRGAAPAACRASPRVAAAA